MFEQYLRPHVAKIANKKPYGFSVVYRCPATWGGCGALVRFVGSSKERQWLCPLCGCVYPWAFWEFKTDHDFSYDGSADSLILATAPDACVVCGESGNPPCRCERIRQAEENERIHERYG